MSTEARVNLAVQSVLAISSVAVYLYLILIGRPIPAELYAIVGAVFLLYFPAIQIAVSRLRMGGNDNGR